MARLVLFLQTPGYTRAYQAASLAVTAAAMGREVRVVFAFEALEQLAAGVFAAPLPDERAYAARAEAIGATGPAAMLEEARRLGAKLHACETVARIAGVDPDVLRGRVDEVLGLANIVTLPEGAEA
ncbi:MAG: DsrE family protein, partial [Myxococcales bacterium]